MKRLIGIFVILNVTLFFWECHKNKGDSIVPKYNTDCYAGSFNTASFINVNFTDICTLPDNTFVAVAQNGVNTSLNYFDSHGRLMKKINTILPNGAKAISLSYTSDGNLLLAAATSNFVDTTAYSSTGINLVTIGNYSYYCNPYSGQSTTGQPYYPQSNVSKTFLIKVDLNGNIIWNKAFNGNAFNGKALTNMGSNTLLLTQIADLGFNIVPGIYYDTLQYRYGNNNKLILYNIDATGKAIWSKEFDSISGVLSYASISAGYTPPLQAVVNANANTIMIQSAYDVKILDAGGHLISQNNFRAYYCSLLNSINSYNYDFYFNAALGQNSYAVYMPVYSNPNRVQIYDLHSNVIGGFSTSLTSAYSYTAMSMDINNNINLYNLSTLLKYDIHGNLIYNDPIASSSSSLVFMTPTCDNGLLMSAAVMRADSLGNTFASSSILKIDKNGNH